MKPLTRMLMTTERRPSRPREGSPSMRYHGADWDDNGPEVYDRRESRPRGNRPSMRYPVGGWDYDGPEASAHGASEWDNLPRNMPGGAMYSVGIKPVERAPMGFANGDDIAPLSQIEAEKWVREMETEDGAKGAHWNIEQVKMLMEQKGIPGNLWAFYAAINAVYSDYSKVLKKHGVGDKIDLYVDLAKAFVNDKDAQHEKLARYYKYIVKH